MNRSLRTASIALVCVVSVGAPALAQAPTYTVLADTDGLKRGGLIRGADGGFYGTTYQSSFGGCGSIYRFVPGSSPTILHAFTGPNGCLPIGELLSGPDGALYGVTFAGGPNVDAQAAAGTGTIFRLTLSGAHTLVHSFAALVNGSYPEGRAPVAGLTLGLDGNFYGMASQGGTGARGPFTFGAGTIFRVTPAGVLTVLHHFVADTSENATGGAPQGPLTLGSDGNLYGTVVGGGANAFGNLFRITPAGQLSRVYTFPFACVCPGAGPFGANPHAAPVEVSGRFYVLGRDYGPDMTTGHGTIVEVTPNGTPNGVGRLLHTFTGPDGATPEVAMTLGADGVLYGIARDGGAHNSGTIFRITTDGAFAKLHDFSFPQGSGPGGRLLEVSPGLFYGTTSGGGSVGSVIFQLSYVPELTSLSPSSAVVGSAGFTLTVNGTRFVNGSQVRWNGSPRPTIFVNEGQLQAAIAASDVATGGTANVTVVNPGPISGPSNALPFAIAPTMALDKTMLAFGAVTSGGTWLSQTSAQIVRLTQTGSGTVTWTATSNRPWLRVSPASGSGSANLSIGIIAAGGLPASGTVTGAISLVLTGASNTPGPIAVTLTLFLNGTSANPIANIDTPTDNRTNVTGAVPFTGWVVDDIEVLEVSVCRAAFGAEVAPVDPRCGGVAQVFIGFGVFIEGARPDVAAAFPGYPASTKAGWGHMVLTNMLPNQGNGTYVFSMWAKDRDGHIVLMGTRTMTCTNASATLPFGTNDTPEQGSVVSGAAYPNFGWALTPLPKTIPTDGSTIIVVVDGVAIGPVASYNNFRPDIATLFPGLNNTNGAVGLRTLDTTAMTNGTHTIAWVVTDNLGAAEGIGSRFFTVSNGAGALTAAITASPVRRRSEAGGTTRVSTLPVDAQALVGRRGWDLDAPVRAFEPDASGRLVVRSEEVSRVELQLGPGEHEGYLRTSEGLVSLPIGSRLDESTGVFTWAPGVGFVGAYDFVFVRRERDGAAVRRDVRVVLQPRGSGAVGPQIVIDAPRSQQDVAQPFVLAGWAADLNAMQGTGIATLHAWAYPLTGGPPVFLGATAYGGIRPDVAAAHGDEFEASGFGLHVQSLPHGSYDIAVFAWSTAQADFAPAKVVRITVR